jgi:uncharacterized membrane protein
MDSFILLLWRVNLHDVSLLFGAIIGGIGAFVIFIGAIRGVYLFVRKFLCKDTLLADVRIEIGHYLALGLEFLVGKDIIETLAEQTWEHFGKLAVLIALRTVLTLFLAHEVKEVREELEEESLIRSLKASFLKRGKSK